MELKIQPLLSPVTFQVLDSPMWLVAVALGAQIETTSSIGESCIGQHGSGALGHFIVLT